MENIKRYIREPVNGLTHAFAAFLGMIGFIVLLYKTVTEGAFNKTLAFSIFGSSMVCMYLSSALFHSLPVKKRGLERFRILDHCMIYVFIAGSYTPMCLLTMKSFWGWVFFAGIWAIALAGIFQKIIWPSEPRWLSTGIYMVAGWLGGLFLLPIIFENHPPAFLIWILTGGVAYTIGAVIYGLKKPNPLPGWFGHHEIWHLFVMIGSLAHFWAFYRFLS
jgi:hemolysin III